MTNLYSKEQKTLSKQGRKNWDRIFKKKSNDGGYLVYLDLKDAILGEIDRMEEEDE